METQLIAQPHVAHQHLHFRCPRRGVQIIRRLPTQHMLSALGQHYSIALLVEVVCQLIRIEQLCVPNGRRFHAQHIVHHRSVLLQLVEELVEVVFRCQGVSKRSCQELDALACGKVFEYINYLRRVLFIQLQHRAGDRQRTMELPFREVHHLAKCLTERHIGGIHQPRDIVLCLNVIVVVMVLTDIKEPIAFQPIRRMHLKAKAYIFHICMVYFYSYSIDLLSFTLCGFSAGRVLCRLAKVPYIL